MAYQNITDVNMTQGVGEIFTYLNVVTGSWFSSMMLISIWIILTIGIYFHKNDIPEAVSTSGFVTLIISIILKLAGLISGVQLGIVFAVAIIGVALLYVDNQ